MLSRLYRRVTVHYADPLYAGRHPFQTYLLALCVVSAVPQILGRRTATSIEALLPHWIATVWLYLLAVGALVALVGSRMPKSRYASALVIEQLGLYMVATPALIYAAAIVLYAGWGGIPAASIVFAFGLSSLIRGRDIGRVLHRARIIAAQPVSGPDLRGR